MQRIGVDMDGVLADQITPLLAIIRDKYGISLAYDDVTDWEYAVGGFTNVAIEIERAFRECRGFIHSMPVVEGARQAMNALSKKHQVSIVTARQPDLLEATRRWLVNNGISFKSIVSSFGVPKCSLDFDILIDDNLDNVIGFARRGRRALLFDRPWNQGSLEDLAGLVIRVRTWNEIPSVVDRVTQVSADGHMVSL